MSATAVRMDLTRENPKTLDLRAGVDLLLDLEEREGLFERSLAGEPFWDDVRMAVFNELFVFNPALASRGATSRSTVSPARWLRAARSLLTFPPAEREPEPCDFLVLNYARTEPIDGVLANKSTYHLVRALTPLGRVAVLDPSLGGEQIRRVYGCDGFNVHQAYLADRLRSRRADVAAGDRRTLAEIRRVVSETFCIEIDFERLFRHTVLFQREQRRSFGSLIDRLRPRAAIYADNSNIKGFIVAARARGVPTLDIQHSLVSYVNPLYHYRRPANAQLQGISDYVLTFAPLWHEEYRSAVRPVACGSAYFDAMHRARPLQERGDDILLVSNPYFRDVLSRYTIEIARALPHRRVAFRMASTEFKSWKRVYPRAMQELPNLVVIDSDDRELYDWLRDASTVIGINSTVMVEAMAIGCRALVIDHMWAAEMDRLVARGVATRVTSPEEAVACIQTGDLGAALPTGDLFLPGAAGRLAAAIVSVASGGRS